MVARDGWTAFFCYGFFSLFSSFAFYISFFPCSLIGGVCFETEVRMKEGWMEGKSNAFYGVLGRETLLFFFFFPSGGVYVAG